LLMTVSQVEQAFKIKHLAGKTLVFRSRCAVEIPNHE
jgi:hypothetical protein